MKDQKMNLKRRQILLGGVGVGAVLPAQWSKPILNSVLTPAHAQASVCPMIVVGNVVFGPVSGTFVPPVCSITFDVLSGDPATSLSITAITNTVAADTTILYDGSPTFSGPTTATGTTGPRVVWQGPASDAPFCSDLMPLNEVTFSITATCAAAPGGGEFSQDFTLAEILA